MDQKLRKAEVHLTYHCDLNCPGCNRACFNKKSNAPPTLSEDRFLEILMQIEKYGFKKDLTFIGGEPTLHSQCIEFLKTGHAYGFQQTIWSNAYSDRSQKVLEEIRSLGIARVCEGTRKIEGALLGFSNPMIFCSPVDLGITRPPCKWSIHCGYSADETGFTPCPIGGMIAHYSAPEAYAESLHLLTDPEYMDQVYSLLCKHCGSFVQMEESYKKSARHKIQNVNGTMMTSFWRTVFQV